MLTGWRTLIFSVLVSVIGILQATDWVSLLNNPKTAGIVVTAIGVASAVLRFMTNTPIGKSDT